MKPAQFELSTDARFIRQRLHEMKPGDEISYEELGKDINKDVTGGMSALQSAKRSLLRDGFVFSAVTGVGIKRLIDVEIVKVGDKDIAVMRRRASKARLKLSTVSAEGLTPASNLDLIAKQSIIGAISIVTDHRSVEAIRGAVGGRSTELPIAATLKALGYHT